jgi:hypothetical protein
VSLNNFYFLCGVSILIGFVIPGIYHMIRQAGTNVCIDHGNTTYTINYIYNNDSTGRSFTLPLFSVGVLLFVTSVVFILTSLGKQAIGSVVISILIISFATALFYSHKFYSIHIKVLDNSVLIERNRLNRLVSVQEIKYLNMTLCRIDELNDFSGVQFSISFDDSMLKNIILSPKMSGIGPNVDIARDVFYKMFASIRQKGEI